MLMQVVLSHSIVDINLKRSIAESIVTVIVLCGNQL